MIRFLKFLNTKNLERITPLVLYLSLSLFIATWWFLAHNGAVLSQIGKTHKDTWRRPYAYRVLPQLAIETPRAVLGSDFHENIGKGIVRSSDLLSKITHKLKVKKEFQTDYLILFLLSVASLFGFFVCARRLFQGLFEGHVLASNLFPLAVGLSLPFVSKQAGYIYDLPALFLFTLALYGMLKEKLYVYYLALVLGILNKETTFLLIPMFLGYFASKLEKKKLMFHIAAQAIVAGALFVLIRDIYDPQSPIGPVNNAMRDYLFNNLNLFSNSSLFRSFPNHFCFLMLVLLALKNFVMRPRFLRIGSLLFVPFCFAYLYGGWWGEIRVLLEISVVLGMLVYVSALELGGVSLTVQEGQRGPMFSYLPKNFSSLTQNLFYFLIAIFSIVMTYAMISVRFLAD